MIHNIGPLSDINLELPFDDEKPLPLVIVGSNGTGKSILQSFIADALVEMGRLCFRDIVATDNAYFRLNGPTNQTVGAKYGLAILRFVNQAEKYTYIEKSGIIENATFLEKIKSIFSDLSPIQENGNFKGLVGVTKEKIETVFITNSYCYFLASRHEVPHWMNLASTQKEECFSINPNIQGKLNKPIIIDCTASQNKTWLMDVFLDSLVDVEKDEKGLHARGNLTVNFLAQEGRKNIEKILQVILRDPGLELALSFRNDQTNRLCLKSKGRVVIPSIDHLSTGQATLFNLILTILRYSDQSDLNKLTDLSKITGIVAIDEIDAHLHSDLQYEVLPELLKLFPGIQFVVSSHAPLFLLGMEESFGPQGYKMIEMPKGEVITLERFSEFEKSFRCFMSTKLFEDSVKENVAKETKPLILTEGETDPIYIKTALELLDRRDLLETVDIEWVGGYEKKGNPYNTGYGGLNNTFSVLAANPQFMKNKIMLLYDCDTNKQNVDEGYLCVRMIKKNELNTKVRKGIENLLPSHCFEDRFYEKKESCDDYGAPRTICEFRKMDFCQYICKEKRDVADFVAFSYVIEIIDEFLAKTEPAK